MHVKTIQISDLHIGSNACKADKLIKFLDKLNCELLILNGDIVDGWRLRNKWYFPQSHLLIIQKLLDLSKRGIKIIYVIGNHDEFLRRFHDYDLNIGDIQIVPEYTHRIQNKNILIVHGDKFDIVTKYHPWIAKLGDHAYEFAVWMNHYLNKCRFLLGMRYWSLSKFLKNQIKSAVSFIFAFEQAAIDEAKICDMDGVFCGHIHNPALYKKDGIIYANSGDWVETCSWIAETYDGHLQTWEWNDGDPVLLNEMMV